MCTKAQNTKEHSFLKNIIFTNIDYSTVISALEKTKNKK